MAAVVAVRGGTLPVAGAAWTPTPESLSSAAPRLDAPALLATHRRSDAVSLGWLVPAGDRLVPIAESDAVPIQANEGVAVARAPTGGIAVLLVGDGIATARAYRWDGEGALEEVAIPGQWPLGGIVSPDGRKLAAGIGNDLSIADLGTGDLSVVAIPHLPTIGYGTPVAWTTDGRSVVLAETPGCIDTCGIRPTYALLTIEAGTIAAYDEATEVEAIATAPWAPASVRTGLFAWTLDGAGALELNHQYEDPDGGRRLPWPPAWGRLTEEMFSSAWSADGTSLYVTALMDDGQHLVEVTGPRAADPGFRDLGVLADPYEVRAVDPGGRWALGSRRGGVDALVDLRNGAGAETLADWDVVGFVELVP